MSAFLVAVVIFVVASRFITPLLIKVTANGISAPKAATATATDSLPEKLFCIINFMLLCFLVILSNKTAVAVVFALLFLVELGYAVSCNKNKGGCYLWLFLRKERSRSANNSRSRGVNSKNHYNQSYARGGYRNNTADYKRTQRPTYDDYGYRNDPRLAQESLSTDDDHESGQDEQMSDTKARASDQMLHRTNKYSIHLSTDDKIPARNIKGKPVYSVVGSNTMWIDKDGVLYYKEDGKILGIRGKECASNRLDISTFSFEGEKEIDRIQAHVPKAALSYYSLVEGEFEAGYFITQYGDTVVDYYITGQGFSHVYSYEDVELYSRGGEHRMLTKIAGKHITLLGGKSGSGSVSFYILKDLGLTALAPTRETPDCWIYSFTKEGKYISSGGDIKSGSAKEEVIKEENLLRKAIKRVQARTSTQAVDQEIVATKTGVNKDGVYNDGTFDLMCRFGEIQFAQAIAYRPFIQSIVAGKLVHNMTAINVINKIGDNWKDIKVKDAALFFDNHLINAIVTKESGEWNMWLTDDETVWFISIVYLSEVDTKIHMDNNIRVKLQKMLSSVLNSFRMKPDALLGYVNTTNAIDYTKVKTTIDAQIYVQEYYTLNPMILAPSMFGVYVVKAMEDIAVVKHALITRAPMGIKMTIRDVVKLRFSGSEELNIYAAKAILSPYEYEQVSLNSNVMAINIEDSYFPAKLGDVYLEAKSLSICDFIALAIPYEGVYEFNFIVSDKKLSCSVFAKAALNTILSPYIHYRNREYVVKEGSKIMMFKK